MAEREVLQAENQRGAFGCGLVAKLVGELHHQARPDAAHISEPVIAEDVAQVLLDLIDEPPLIAPLERDLVIPANQISHRDSQPRA